MQALRSLALNSYGMFQPMGPNLRLSCTTLCRKDMTNSSCRHSCLQDTQHADAVSTKEAQCSITLAM